MVGVVVVVVVRTLRTRRGSNPSKQTEMFAFQKQSQARRNEQQRNRRAQ
jgi:hypothetical protein